MEIEGRPVDVCGADDVVDRGVAIGVRREQVGGRGEDSGTRLAALLFLIGITAGQSPRRGIGVVAPVPLSRQLAALHCRSHRDSRSCPAVQLMALMFPAPARRWLG